MGLANSSDKFGSLTKTLHWSIAALFFVQYFLVYRREYLPKDSPENLEYLLLHKSLGVVVFFLALIMIFWRQVGRRPMMPISMSGAEILLAKLTHFFLYLAMLVMPISGYLMSSLKGYGVSLFGLPIPNVFHKNPELAGFFHETHVLSSFVIIGLVGLHVLAALYHHVIRRDNILKRML